jgi:hypothetical protein
LQPVGQPIGQTGWQTGRVVYTDFQHVGQPVGQPVASCKRSLKVCPLSPEICRQTSTFQHASAHSMDRARKREKVT